MKYFYHGNTRKNTPPIPQRYKSDPLPADINADPEIVATMKFLESEPEGKKFNAMVKQFQQNKWYGFVMYSLNGREVVKFHYMFGVIVRKEIRMWADGWSYQDLKDRLQKLHGILIAIPESMRSSTNSNVMMKRGEE